MEEAQRKLAADGEWEKLMREIEKSGRTIVSSALYEDVTP
jgi:tmRNA-binding protein